MILKKKQIIIKLNKKSNDENSFKQNNEINDKKTNLNNENGLCYLTLFKGDNI